MNQEKILRLQKAIAKEETKIAKAAGAKEQILNRIKEEYSIDTIEEVRKLLKIKNKKLKKLSKELEKAEKELDKRWSEYLDKSQSSL